MTHTPGPWPFEATGDGKRYIVGDGLVDGPGGYEVAEVYADDCDSQEALANARLIAASPELLAALEANVQAMVAFGITGGAIDASRATISKAKGETT